MVKEPAIPSIPPPLERVPTDESWQRTTDDQDEQDMTSDEQDMTSTIGIDEQDTTSEEIQIQEDKETPMDDDEEVETTERLSTSTETPRPSEDASSS